ncbi:Cupin domain protein [uncultured archaeon]|nr:Cupin domain protein [uncultured archaeon]
MSVRYLAWNKPRLPTEDELKKQLLKENLKPYFELMERDEASEVHQHRFDEARILVSGKVEFCAEGRSFVLKPGDRVDLVKHTAHTIKNLERGQSVMLCAEKGQSVYVEIY